MPKGAVIFDGPFEWPRAEERVAEVSELIQYPRRSRWRRLIRWWRRLIG